MNNPGADPGISEREVGGGGALYTIVVAFNVNVTSSKGVRSHVPPPKKCF